MKNFLRALSIVLAITMILGMSACKKVSGNASSEMEVVYKDYTDVADEAEKSDNTDSADNANTQQSTENKTSDNKTSGNQKTESGKDNKTNNNTSTTTVDNSNNVSVNTNKSQMPDVTLCVRVASDIYIVGGVCSANTEYVKVGGTGVNSVNITPAKGENSGYFIGQVSIDYSTVLEIQGKESGKDLSDKIKKSVGLNLSQRNLMTNGDYMPVFGSDSRMHYYSAILSYTMSNVANSGIKSAANQNIGETVANAGNVGAEVIYLVVPSSAAVYPETLPSEYTAASGETLYQAFNSVAVSKGAKVIYPLDVMKSHKNDGDGYKIYSHTDSHWTTYGAYWGVNELMNYVSSKYPSAKPRSVAEMGFYVTELYGGDSLFSFGDGLGFENFSRADSSGGATSITKIKELTTLYSLKMPTDTLSQITRNRKSIYLTKANEGESPFDNPNGAGLPTAVVVRDSFGRTAYDMVNDRFSKVHWLAEGDYTSVANAIYADQPNYVIYIVSERNLLKVMLNNKDINLCK